MRWYNELFSEFYKYILVCTIKKKVERRTRKIEHALELNINFNLF